MSNDRFDFDEESFRRKVEEDFDKKVPDLTKTLNIAVIGKVSAGKSSLLNALLRRTRDNPVATVGARSGVTTNVKVLPLDEHVCLIDSPGLDDIQAENSEITRKFLASVDLGLLVVTGSADASQKAHLDQLRQHCTRVFVVLNKIDEWDRLTQTALDDVVAQWRAALGAERIYPTCAFGYDPATRPDVPLDIRGVDTLRADIEDFLDREGKALLLARQMGEKRAYAQRIIVAAVVAVAGEAFIPGSAVYITATQAAAIVALYYLYTGRALSKSSALAALPTFAAETVGSTLFLWAKSFLPPTVVLDVAAAGVAATVTAAILLTVNSMFSAGAELHEETRLRASFRQLRSQVKETIGNASKSELLSKEFWIKIIHDLMYAA